MMAAKKVEQQSKKMEIAFLHEDGTWDAEIHDIPEAGDEYESVQVWWEDASKESQYRKVVLAVLFNEHPEDRH